MPTLIIDEQEVHADEGQTVLEAAQSAGFDIPTLCYHPLLEPQGACRMCTVEVIRGGRSRLETSCTYPAWDGLEIKTNSPAVRETRTADPLQQRRCRVAGLRPGDRQRQQFRQRLHRQAAAAER